MKFVYGNVSLPNSEEDVDEINTICTKDSVHQELYEVEKRMKEYIMCKNCFHMEPIKIRVNNKIRLDRRNERVEVSNKTYCYYECPECGNHAVGIELDFHIAPIIQVLNKKGYYTLFCCEGHSIYDGGYIYFEDDFAMRYIVYLPDSCFVDLGDLREDKLIIRFEYCNKYRALEEIYEWALQLPDRHIPRFFNGGAIYEFNCK